MSDFTNYTSIIAIIISIVVGVYVYRELSNTRAKLGEIKFLKNNTVNIESRMLNMNKQLKTLNANKVIYNDDACSSDSGEEYDVFASSDDEDECDVEYNDEDNLSSISEEDVQPESVEIEEVMQLNSEPVTITET